MRIIVEHSLPTDLGLLREFVAEAIRLVDSDMTSYVSVEAGWLRVCSVKKGGESYELHD